MIIKKHIAAAFIALVAPFISFSPATKAQFSNILPTSRSKVVIENLKRDGEYDSLMEAVKAARKNNGRTDVENAESALAQSAKLLASDAARDDFFGFSVAISGDTVIVGGYGEDTAPNEFNGAAYVFVKSGATWSQQAKLVASDAASNDWFGSSVAISGDTAIVGAFQEDSNSRMDNGAAYVFVRNGTTWTQQTKLLAADGASFENFGYSVAILGDTALVGAVVESTAPNTLNGAAYVFVRSGATWSEQTKLLASDAASSDGFGYSVGLSGNTAIVGAAGEDTAATSNNGAAYIFVRNGAVWTEQTKLLASDAATDDRFGTVVAISGDTVIVGAPGKEIVTVSTEGAAYIFGRNGTTWTEQTRLLASDPASNDQFGINVAISGDTAIVGAHEEDTFPNFGNGAAYVFLRSGTSWSQRTKLLALDAGLNDNFGRGVAISDDTVAIGAPTESTDPNIANGAAYVFRTVKSPFDFDGDSKTDLSIFRPVNGQWWYQRSSDAVVPVAQFGVSTDRLTPGDFTGDGKADVAFWRPSTGFWFILRSEDSAFYSFPFGATGDVPVPADYDGDGRADAAVFRPSNSAWFILRSSDLGTTIVNFGTTGDKPVTADYDGDGKSDIGIFRPTDGTWWHTRSLDGGLRVYQFGNSSDRPTPGDFTGDGKADVAFWRPSTGFWFILRSEDIAFYSFPWGTTGDVPTPGDYDGDGKFDSAIFRPSNSTWFVNRSTSGTFIQQFGIANDLPVPNAFVP